MNLPTSSMNRPVPAPVPIAASGITHGASTTRTRIAAITSSSPPQSMWAMCSSPPPTCGYPDRSRNQRVPTTAIVNETMTRSSDRSAPWRIMLGRRGPGRGEALGGPAVATRAGLQTVGRPGIGDHAVAQAPGMLVGGLRGVDQGDLIGRQLAPAVLAGGLGGEERDLRLAGLPDHGHEHDERQEGDRPG